MKVQGSYSARLHKLMKFQQLHYGTKMTFHKYWIYENAVARIAAAAKVLPELQVTRDTCCCWHKEKTISAKET